MLELVSVNHVRCVEVCHCNLVDKDLSMQLCVNPSLVIRQVLDPLVVLDKAGHEIKLVIQKIGVLGFWGYIKSSMK